MRGALARVHVLASVARLVLGGREQVAGRVGRGALAGRLEVLVLAEQDHVRPVLRVVREAPFDERLQISRFSFKFCKKKGDSKRDGYIYFWLLLLLV